jgi:pantoate--beta-alanine ligase
MQKFSKRVRAAGLRLGLVPTMGFLHAGHLSLVAKARKLCDVVVVSIFVNPTQFGAGEDFKKYPRDLPRDLKLLRQTGVAAVFYPSATEVYPPDFQTEVKVKALSANLCGLSRPAHFAGVATVVLKLFNIVRPDVAVFGQKDYQQLLVIKKMVADLNLGVKIMAGSIIREKNGLAMSSRNRYLGVADRHWAAKLYAALIYGKKLIKRGERGVAQLKKQILHRLRQDKKIKIEYLEVLNAANLDPLAKIRGKVLIALAVRLAGVRLIDNIIVETG